MTRHQQWRLAGIFLLAAVAPAALGGVTDLYNFTDGVDGAVPQSGLIEVGNGLLYGTAINGGTNGFGTVYRVTTSGAFSPLYSFTGSADGAVPWGGLRQLPNGILYGTTLEGANGFGTVFEMTMNGTVTPLYAFTGGNDGAAPEGALALGPDGNLYGTASSGGGANVGTVFQVTPAGAFRPLYSFTGNADGGTPATGLTLGANNSFYGSTSSGGVSSNGTLFKIDLAGHLTLLYTFTNGVDGASPQAALVAASDGNFYGAASAGGAAHNGTIFRLTPAGRLTALYSFSADNGGTNADGISPAALMASSDGNLYGVTANGGANGAGTIFKASLAGAVTPLYSFGAVSTDTYTNEDGAAPTSIAQASNGGFYGTTASGGPQALGSLFEFGGSTPFEFLTPGGVQYTNGAAILRLSGLNGQGSIVVDASSNLTQWAPILTNPPATGQIQVTDTAAHSFGSRFYRARMAP